MNNAEVIPKRACHKPSHTNPWIPPVKGATSGNLQIARRDMLQTRRDVRLSTRAALPVPSHGVPRVRFPLSAVFCTGASGRFHTAPAFAVLYPVYRPEVTRSPLLPAVFRVQFLLPPVSFLACCCCSLFRPPRSCGRLLLPCRVPYFVFHSPLSSARTPVPPCPMTSQDLLGSARGDLCLFS